MLYQMGQFILTNDSISLVFSSSPLIDFKLVLMVALLSKAKAWAKCVPGSTKGGSTSILGQHQRSNNKLWVEFPNELADSKQHELSWSFFFGNIHEVSWSNKTKFSYITSKWVQENHYSQGQLFLGWPENVTVLKYGYGKKY